MEFVKVAASADVPVGKALAVEVKGKRIALFNLDNEVYAIDDECSHAGGSLAEGEINDTTVTCPWHGAQFDITTGSATGAPAFEGVHSYPVKIENNDILIGI